MVSFTAYPVTNPRDPASRSNASGLPHIMPMIKLLGALPFIGFLVGAIFFNYPAPFIFGLPPLLAWLIFCILATSVIMAIVYKLDPANRATSTSEPEA